ncbi:MAG: hypothetical protein IT514_16275, partial [Burkholderiales bacterium]|nr:hypothetical protein [Burkholderiales bacterium]
MRVRSVDAQVFLSLTLVCAWASVVPSGASPLPADLHPPSELAQTPVGQLNQFINNSTAGGAGSGHRASLQLDRLTIDARLLTPLNSDFNCPGDPVRAKVIACSDGRASGALPPGTVLEGFVEGVSHSGRPRCDGSIIVRFYWARVGTRVIDLNLASTSKDGCEHPRAASLSKKQLLRGALMSAATIAIPLAVGSGGISLAITTGAGAALGTLFADDGKRLQGALRGAWEGSGLSGIDRLVGKGRPVMLAEGAEIQLRITERLVLDDVPSDASRCAIPSAPPTASRLLPIPFLSTRARLIAGGGDRRPAQITKS